MFRTCRLTRIWPVFIKNSFELSRIGRNKQRLVYVALCDTGCRY